MQVASARADKVETGFASERAPTSQARNSIQAFRRDQAKAFPLDRRKPFSPSQLRGARSTARRDKYKGTETAPFLDMCVKSVTVR
jgi:hypothetical protein